MTGTLQQETAMHWRKVPSSSNGKVFYVVLLALTALVAVSTVLLVLHFHA
jgi:cell division protein FtsL